MFQIINGQEISLKIKEEIKIKINELNINPCLAVVLVGNEPASQIYVRNKEKACEKCGIKSLKYGLDENTTEKELIDLIKKLNENKAVNAILVQFPLPKHINEKNIINTISPEKDVDCFHPLNVGKLLIEKNFENLLVPCTAEGCLILIESVCKNLSGKKAVVVGRSNLVGKPVAQLLLNKDCTVSILHSKTKNLEEETKTADILVVAIGKDRFIKKEMIKDDCIVIDVGINRNENKIFGDVDFENVKEKCSFITPVPKGVGPMTIACLMRNTLKCYFKQNKIL